MVASHKCHNSIKPGGYSVAYSEMITIDTIDYMNNDSDSAGIATNVLGFIFKNYDGIPNDSDKI